MDLSLQHEANRLSGTPQPCFNPCFNGSFTSTMPYSISILPYFHVSILVLMDLSLQLELPSKPSDPEIKVSILVLMDLSLQQKLLSQGKWYWQSFNPCFNGSFTSTR